MQPGFEGALVDAVIVLFAVASIAAAVLILKKFSKKNQSPGQGQKIADFPPPGKVFQAEINQIRRMVPAIRPAQIQKTTSPPHEEIDVLRGRSDITGSLLALVEKYSLDTFTIATVDGLVFASSGGDDAHMNAATYATMTSPDTLSKTITVIVPGLTHQGSTLAGIIRTRSPVPDEVMQKITRETQAILNWWV